MNGVDRIEVVEGGGSTLYGTGAVGGIINVITDRSTTTSALMATVRSANGDCKVNTPHVQFSRTLATNTFGSPGGAVRPDSDYASSSLHVNGSRRVGAFDVALRAGLTADHVGAPGFYEF